MKILVLNCGSSSVKYKLIDTDTDKPLQKVVSKKSVLQMVSLNSKRLMAAKRLPNLD